MANVISEYRRLLISDESIATLDDAMRLAVRVSSGESGMTRKRSKKMLNGELPGFRLFDRNATGDWRAKQVAIVLSEIPLLIDEYFDELPQRQYSLLMDTLLLVFHHAYFALLPHAKEHRAVLLKAFREFAAKVPRREDQFQILGLVEIEEKEFEAAADSFRAAIAATHSDEHDFVTRVQLLWTTLMDRGRFSDAFDCLIDVYPRASRLDLGELSNLLRETFLESLRHTSPAPASSQRRRHA